MTQYYRNQNESGRGQDYPRSGHRNMASGDRNEGGRERYATGNERRYSPDWDDRSHDAGQFDDGWRGSFEGDRSYSAGGYPEEFGYRQEGHSPRGQNYRFGEASGHDQERFGGYHGGSSERFGSNENHGSRDFGRNPASRQGAYRGDDFNRGRGGYHGSGSEYGESQRYGSRGSMQTPYGEQGHSTRGFEHGRSWSNMQSGQSGQMGQSGQWQQSHRGRGPKGYERSDERLKEMICERLTDDPNIDASEVTIEIDNKVVKLTGTVEDRRIKYMIEDAIEQIGGVRDIDNQLRVQSFTGSQSQQSSQSSQHYGMTGSDNTSAGRTAENKSGTQSSTSSVNSPKRN
jgi:osmotically-inducible protein OsmY